MFKNAELPHTALDPFMKQYTLKIDLNLLLFKVL